jgi:hypothetical protein
MKRTMRASLTLLAALCMLLACTSPVASEQAEGKAWDQAAVTALAQELVQAAGDLRDTVRRQPDILSRSVQRARNQTLDDIRVAQGSIRSLARQLENDGDRLSTYPTFRRIQMLRRDIARNVRRAALTEPTPSKLEAARAVLEQLGPFYSAEAAAYEAETDD